MPHKIKPVKIRHKSGLESEVDEPSVRHWERAGWVRVDSDSVKTAPAKSAQRTTREEG